MKKLIIAAFAVLLSINAGAQVFYTMPAITSTKQSLQGSAAYDGILFQFHNACGVCEVFDLNAKTKIGEIVQPETSAWHCNTVAFSTKRYAKGDKFPLLYVSTERDRRILVYRITGARPQYAFSLVQTIHLPKSEDMGLYFPNSIIDGKGGALWLSGYSRNSWQKPDGGNHIRYVKFKLPKVKDGDVTIDMSRAKKEFTIPFSFATQGVIFYKGKIVQSYGVNIDNAVFRVISPKTGRIVEEIVARQLGMNEEPEGMFQLPGGGLGVSTQSRKCWRLPFTSF